MRAPGIRTYYRLTVTDTKTGKVVRRTHRRRSRSLLKAYAQHIYSAWGLTNPTVIDTSGANKTLAAPADSASQLFQIISAAGSDAKGIVVGTGTAAVDISDYALGTLIAHGGGATQLNYGEFAYATQFGALVTGATSSSFTFSRAFSNTSGATITITEVGVYCLDVDLVPALFYSALVRDLVSGGVAVGDGQSVTVEYTFSVNE